MSISPAKAQIKSIEKAYAYFNRVLFFRKLPECVLTLGSPGKKSLGSMLSYSWITDVEGEIFHQITLDRRVFAYVPMEVHSTLVHEMVHLWQYEYGTPSKNAPYHNKEWARKMKEVGLIPSHTGDVGGKETGNKVSHYIESGGRFEKAFNKLPASCSYPLTTRMPDELYPAKVRVVPSRKNQNKEENRQRSGTSKATYICPKCGQRAYGSQKLMLNCGVCEVAMERKVD